MRSEETKGIAAGSADLTPHPSLLTPHFQVATLAETEAFGRRLGSLLFPGAVIALIGQLGAGKTHLTRAVAEGLNVRNPLAVTSPTFVLVHEYAARLPIYHFDAYRLSGDREFLDLGADEYFHGDGVCVVEWADRVPGALPAARLDIHIQATGETSRRFTLRAFGGRYEDLIRRMTPVPSHLGRSSMKTQGSAVWQGGFKDGKGSISTKSGALKDHPYGAGSRFEGKPGTNPEELIGAAHAGCFTMALSLMLGEAGMTAETMTTTADVTLDKVADGFAVTSVHLTLKAKIPGADKAKFDEVAAKAKAGCPISKLLKTEITLDATLEN